MNAFIAAIKGCPAFSPYAIEGTRTVYDATGTEITDPTLEST